MRFQLSQLQLEPSFKSTSESVDSNNLLICLALPAPAHLHHFIHPPPLPPPFSFFFKPASDNVTFCQSAGNHATVAAGSAVAATEIDSNKCRERKRRGGGRGGEEGPKGRKKKKGRERGEKTKQKKEWKRTAEAVYTG